MADGVERAARLSLLDKRELRIDGVRLNGANLGALSVAVATALDLHSDEVLVTDVLADVVTFDILRPSLYPHQLVGRHDAVLAALAGIEGVELDRKAKVTSNGVLGWIPADPESLASAIDKAQAMVEGISARIAHRVCVLSTGDEVARGDIKDTNRQTLSSVLGQDYDVTFGGTVRDDRELIAGRIRAAVDAGFGVVVTTGGVGAEHKDHTIEALLTLDPDAATPYLTYFSPDHHRHAKQGIRIGVGELHGTVIVALPGPNEEVRVAATVLLDNLRAGTRRDELAAQIAAGLRGHLRKRMEHSSQAGWKDQHGSHA